MFGYELGVKRRCLYISDHHGPGLLYLDKVRTQYNPSSQFSNFTYPSLQSDIVVDSHFQSEIHQTHVKLHIQDLFWYPALRSVSISSHVSLILSSRNIPASDSCRSHTLRPWSDTFSKTLFELKTYYHIIIIQVQNPVFSYELGW